MSIRSNGQTLEHITYIAAAFNAANLTPEEARGRLNRHIGVYYNKGSDEAAQLVTLEKTPESASDLFLKLRKKSGIDMMYDIVYEQGCGIRTVRDSGGKEVPCCISCLDEDEKGVIWDRLSPIKEYTAAVAIPTYLKMEEAIEQRLRAIVFYQTDPDGVAQFVVSKGTAEEAINILINLKGKDGISDILYEQEGGIRIARAKLKDKRDQKLKYMRFEYTLSALDPKERGKMEGIWLMAKISSLDRR